MLIKLWRGWRLCYIIYNAIGGNYSYGDILQVHNNLNLPDPHGYKEELRNLASLWSSM